MEMRDLALTYPFGQGQCKPTQPTPQGFHSLLTLTCKDRDIPLVPTISHIEYEDVVKDHLNCLAQATLLRNSSAIMDSFGIQQQKDTNIYNKDVNKNDRSKNNKNNNVHNSNFLLSRSNNYLPDSE